MTQTATAAPTATLEDEDALEGFQAYFLASDVMKASLPGGLRRGRLKKGVDEAAANPDKIQCYATIECEAGPRPREIITGRHCKDFRKVTITCYGTKDKVIAAAALWRALLNRQPYRTDAPALAIPNAKLCGCIEIDGSSRLEQDTTTKKGFDIWKARVMFQVLTGRTTP